MHRDCPGSQAVNAAQRPGQFRLSRPHQSCNAQNLPPAQGEADSLVTVQHGGHILHFQHHFLPRMAFFGPFLYLLARNHGHQVLRRYTGNLPGLNLLPVPQNRHPISDLIQLRHPVGDIHNANAAGFQTADHVKERLNLLWREGRGRLVKNNYSALSGNRLHNLNNLLFRNPQTAHLGLRVQLIIHLLQKRPRLTVHLLPVKEAAFFQLPPLKNVLRHRNIVIDHQLLIDYPDA